MSVVAYIGVGTNAGNAAMNVRRAVRALSEAGVVRRVSTVRRTRPWGRIAQPDFFNAVARIETMSRPQALLARLQSLERRLGRRPSYHWGPRVIDLDILLYGGMRVNEPNLVIPHSCLAQRPFMLALLGEVFQEPRTALREGPRVL